jgi:hypothetical protein
MFGAGGATPGDTLAFDYLSRHYTGDADVNGSFYTIHLHCGSTTGGVPGPVNPTFLSIPPTASFPFGATRLKGSQTNQFQRWAWDFH